MKSIQSFISCIFMLTLVGCATIAGNNSRAVKVESIPSGASIYVDNKRFGETPALITLPTHIYGGKAITLKKSGYRDVTMMVNDKFQLIALLDIFFWPTFLVDVATGDIVQIDPANTYFNEKLQRV